MENIKPYLPSGMSLNGMIFYSLIVYIFCTSLTYLLTPYITDLIDVE